MIEKGGVTDAVKKVSQQIGSEIDMLRCDLEDMHCKTRQNFALASQQFQTISNSMGVLTTCIPTLMSQLQCMTHAMLGQCEERQLGDKIYMIDMRIMRLESMANRAVTAEEKQAFKEKIMNIENTQDELNLCYDNLSTGITNILTGPLQAALPPLQIPPGLMNDSMPPSSPSTMPITPKLQNDNFLPPTPVMTPSKNVKHMNLSTNQASPLKKPCMSPTTI